MGGTACALPVPAPGPDCAARTPARRGRAPGRGAARTVAQCGDPCGLVRRRGPPLDLGCAHPGSGAARAALDPGNPAGRPAAGRWSTPAAAVGRTGRPILAGRATHQQPVVAAVARCRRLATLPACSGAGPGGRPVAAAAALLCLVARALGRAPTRIRRLGRHPGAHRLGCRALPDRTRAGLAGSRPAALDRSQPGPGGATGGGQGGSRPVADGA